LQPRRGTIARQAVLSICGAAITGRRYAEYPALFTDIGNGLVALSVPLSFLPSTDIFAVNQKGVGVPSAGFIIPEFTDKFLPSAETVPKQLCQVHWV